MNKVNIIILNYNGRSLLEECLPSIVDAASFSKNNCKVTVLDNRSTDGSVDFLKSAFPEVEVYVSPKNRVLCSYNEYIERSDDDIVILLNSDIKVDKAFVDPLVDSLSSNKDAFMAGPKCWTFDKKQYEGARSKIGMKFGFFQCFSRYKGYEDDIDKPGYTANIGSFVAFKKNRFLELGGYDDLYLPGRCEDLDICYRGWKRGWKGYYVPQSLVYHKGLESFNKAFGYKKSLVMAYRNTFLFTWKNITDGYHVFRHIFFLFPWLVFSVLKLNFSFVRGFAEALPRLPQALKRRKPESLLFKKSYDSNFYQCPGN